MFKSFLTLGIFGIALFGILELTNPENSKKDQECYVDMFLYNSNLTKAEATIYKIVDTNDKYIIMQSLFEKQRITGIEKSQLKDFIKVECEKYY